MARETLGLHSALLQLCKLSCEDELVQARLSVKMHASDLAFSSINQTKIVTATSELGRNVLEHGLGGTMQIDKVSCDERVGLRLIFTDSGPGIADLELALTDGYSSKKGLGLGLTGSKRLMDDFEIDSKPLEGTKIVVIKWK